jgi:hypothetical protein
VIRYIDGVVNSVARLKADIALSNPVVLYFGDLSAVGWKHRTARTRNRTGLMCVAVTAIQSVLSMKFRKELGFVGGDITIDGYPIEIGAQIADFISIKAVAVACRFSRSTATPMTACVEDIKPTATPSARLLRGVSG